MTDKCYLRVKQIIGDPKADPPIPAIIPISRSTLYYKVQKGELPKPIYPLGRNIALWDRDELLSAMNKEISE